MPALLRWQCHDAPPDGYIFGFRILAQGAACYSARMTRYLGLLLVGSCLLGAGCGSLRFGPYTSPRVTGRVVAANSGQPLAGVEVWRGARRPDHSLAGFPKGGELLLEKPAARTGSDGRFSLPSERALTLFRPSGWSFVQLAFCRPGYQTYQTNYSILSALTNAPNGEPLLQTGDIRLRPS